MLTLSAFASAAKWLVTSQAGRALILAAALGAVLWWAYATVHERGAEEGRAEVRAEFDAHLAADEKATKRAEVAARARERQQREEMDALAAHYEKEKRDAETIAGRTLADLRSGALRLRDHWQGCVATAGLSRAAESAALADERTRLREEGARDLVRVVEDAEAQIRGLQSALKACAR